jgi:hypothetical protein
LGVVFGPHRQKRLRGTFGENRERLFQTERDQALGVKDGGFATRGHDADHACGGAGQGSNARAEAALGGSAEGRAHPRRGRHRAHIAADA